MKSTMAIIRPQHMRIRKIEAVGDGYMVTFIAQTIHLTAQHITNMRCWAYDCDWLDSDDLASMDNETIIRGVNKHFDGGLDGFLSTEPVLIP